MTVTCKYDEDQLRMMQEMLIVIDSNDNIIGSASKQDCHLNINIKNGLLHRAFSVFLFGKDGNSYRLLLQTRSMAKITFPAMLTNTCCSHPLSSIDGESNGVDGVKRAAIRKLKHELGIEKLHVKDLSFVGKFQYTAESCTKWGEAEIDYVLVGVCGSVAEGKSMITENFNEVSGTEWMSMEDICALMKSENAAKFTPWFRTIWESGLLGDIWKSVEDGNGMIAEKKTEEISFVRQASH